MPMKERASLFCSASQRGSASAPLSPRAAGSLSGPRRMEAGRAASARASTEGCPTSCSISAVSALSSPRWRRGNVSVGASGSLGAGIPRHGREGDWPRNRVLDGPADMDISHRRTKSDMISSMPARRYSTREPRAAYVDRRLEELYPNPAIPLDHRDAYTLLVAVVLSAQCTDKRVNLTTPALFALADTPEKMAQVPV